MSTEWKAEESRRQKSKGETSSNPLMPNLNFMQEAWQRVRPLPTHLPGLNCIHGSNQHKDFKQQAVVNPNDQDQFKGSKQKERTAQAKSLRNQKSRNAAEDIAERIDDRVAVVAKRGGCRAIAFNDEVCVF